MVRRQQIGLFLGPVLFIALLIFPNPSGLSTPGWNCAAVVLLMATWWITEAIPISATAFIPIVAFPILGVGTVRESTIPFAEPIIFLFMGGFLIALAMQRWNLHRWIALRIIRKVGTSREALVGGFMLSAALLSMWISNTATALMLLPVALSIVELNGQRAVGQDNSFATLLLLALAYGCNIGGMATLIGTPPNAFLAGFMEQEYGYTISFVNWLGIGIPLVVVLLPIAYLILTKLYDSNESGSSPIAGSEFTIDTESAGALTREQRLVAATFLVTTLLWITRPLVARYVPGITDAGIAMLGGLVLFVIPSDFKKNIFLLDWPTAKGLPWETLILFGGGLSLASAFTRTGLSQWFGELLSTFGSLPIFVVIAIVTAAVVFLTELTSNTATAATLLPIVAALAVGIGQHPMLLAVPAALGASCAFMLPVATPPNAIVYASERVTIPQMVRAGLLVNIASIVVISMVAYTIVMWWFGLAN